MIKKLSILFVCLCVLISFCGCSDLVEPENRIILTAIGLDEADGKLILSAESADVISNTNEDIYNSHFLSVSADNLSSALNELKNRSYGKIMFSQCPIILIGKTAGNKNFKDFIDFCIKEHEISFSVRLLYCDNAQKILNSDKSKDTLIGYEILKLTEYGKKSAVIETESLPLIFDKMKNNESFSLPEIKLIKGQLEISENKRIEVN